MVLVRKPGGHALPRDPAIKRRRPHNLGNVGEPSLFVFWGDAKRGRFAYDDPPRTSLTSAGAFTTNSRVSLPAPVVFGTKNELKSSRI